MQIILKDPPCIDFATANVQALQIVFNNNPEKYLQTLCDIHPNEQLGVSYGVAYWKLKKCVPNYFDKHGYVIPEAEIALNKISNTYTPTLEVNWP